MTPFQIEGVDIVIRLLEQIKTLTGSDIQKNLNLALQGLEAVCNVAEDVCRCGNTLPSVKDNEIPFQFCSQKCKDGEAKNHV